MGDLGERVSKVVKSKAESTHDRLEGTQGASQEKNIIRGVFMGVRPLMLLALHLPLG